MKNFMGLLKGKPFSKILSWILIFALIFGQLSSPILVLAQETISTDETNQPIETPQPTPQPSPSPQSSATPEPTPSASTTPEPSTTPQPSPTPLPSDNPEASSSATPQPSSTPEPTPTTTPIPSATPSPQPEESSPSGKLEKSGIKRETNKVLRKKEGKLVEIVKSESGDYVEGEALVKYKRNNINLNNFIDKPKTWVFEKRHNVKVIDEIKDSNIQVVKTETSTKEAVEQLKKDPNVEIAEPNYVYPLTVVPDDPKFNQLWGMENSGQSVDGTVGISDADIDAPEAWELEKASQPDVVVAVLDTGVDYTHPDLAANMWDGAAGCKDDAGNTISGGCPKHGWDFDSNDNDPQDEYGHGTHVSGTIAGVANNNVGIAGSSIHNNIKIMAVRVNLEGSGVVYTQTVIKGINFAKHNNAKVINASFGDFVYSQLMKDAIDAFPGLFVAAAGNYQNNNDSEPFYPASFNSPNIIAVAATDQEDKLASFSHYGPTSVDVGAPGVNILSAVPGSKTFSYEEKDFQYFNDVTPPAIPNGYTKTGDFGTKNLENSSNTAGGLLGNVLYGDVVSIPYKHNADYTFTSPKFNLAGFDGVRMSFLSRCDTEYEPIYTDYMVLEISKDGQNFNFAGRWDEWDLDNINGEHDPTGSSQAFLEADFPQAYANENFKYRLIWHTDGSVTGDLGLGCFVDNVTISGANLTGSEALYEYWPGTSMATPHVVGEAAMLLSYKPTLTTQQVKDTILNTGDPLPALQGKTVSGKRINLNNALRSVSQSSNADLSNLTISQGTLTPSFSPSITSYSAQVANNISTIKVTPTALDSKSSVKVNGVSVVSGTSSPDINLNVGNNLISIEVIAENLSTKSYTINVVRAAPDTVAPIIVIARSPNKDLNNGSYTLTVNFDDAVTKKYKVDSGSLTDYTQPVTISAEGSHTFYAEGIDASGNKGTAQISFEIDITAPSVTITKNPDQALSNTSYILTVNFSDATAKEYRINSGSWLNYTGEVTVANEGNYTFEARGTDLAGNQTTTQTTFSIDKTNPIITINSPAANARVSGINTIEFSLNEPAEVKCSLDNHNFKSCSSEDTFASLDLFDNFIDGPFTLYVQAQDPAGNIATVDRGFIKDTHVPLAPGTPTAEAGPMINNQEYSSGFIVVVSLPSDAAPNHIIKIYLGQTEFISDSLTQAQISSGKYIFVVGIGTLGQDGMKIFRARIIDHLDRISPLSNALTLTLDTQAPSAPVITAIAADNKINALEKQNVLVNGTSEANSLIKINLTDQISTKSASVKLTNNQTDYSVPADSSTLNDGNILVIAQAEDEAGNISPISTKNAVKDTIIPTLTDVSISSSNPNPALAKIGDTISLIFRSSENLDNYSVSINGLSANLGQIGPNQYLASRNVSTDDPNGEVAFNISYADGVGNMGEMIISTTDNSKVVVDKIKPVLAQVTAVKSPANDNTPDYTFSSTKAGHLTYGGSCLSSTLEANVGNNTITFNALNDGPYNNCYIQATDSAGNISDQLKVNEFVIDTASPAAVLVINSGAKYTNSSQLVLTLDSAANDIAQVEIAEGASGDFQSPFSYGGPISYNLSDTSQGQKTIKVRLTDTAGNISSQDLVSNIIYDSISPVISQQALINKTTGNSSYVKNGDKVDIIANIADLNQSDIPTSHILANLTSLGGSNSAPASSFNPIVGQVVWSDVVVTQTAEGFISVGIEAKDAASNTTSITWNATEADNSIPVAISDYFTTTKNVSVMINSALVLSNDTDSSGDILVLSNFSQPINGTISANGSDVLFTPNQDFIGTATLNYTITDGAHQVTGTIYIVITPPIENNQTVLQPSTTLNPDTNKVVVVNVPFESTVNVPSSVNNASLDLSNISSFSAEITSATLGGKININSTTSVGNISLALPESLTISGSSGWNGSLNVPTLLDNSTFIATPSAGTNTTTTAVVEVGFGDTQLILNKAARIVIPGKAFQQTGVVRSNVFIPINIICSADTQQAANQLPEEGDCKMDVGSDLVIWTKHFTKFVTYTETAIPPAGSSSGSASNSSSSGGSSTSSGGPAVCSDTKPGDAPKLLSAKAGANNEVTLIWSKASDPVTYYLIAYGTKSGKMEYGNPNIGDKNTTSYTVKNLSGGTTYFFRVRAGNNCMPGEFSNEASATTYGSKISDPAKGFDKGVLSKQTNQKGSNDQVTKSNLNVLEVIRNFFIQLFSNLRLTQKVS